MQDLLCSNGHLEEPGPGPVPVPVPVQYHAMVHVKRMPRRASWTSTGASVPYSLLYVWIACMGQ